MKLNSNPCSFRDLFQIEFREARNCLGVDFWNDIKAALADHSAEPAYESGTTYNAGDIVKFEGIYYEATTTTTAIPTVASDWEEAPKFTGACAEKYDDFYCDFLGPYLAFTVLSVRLPYLRNVATDIGVIQYEGNRYEPAEMKEYRSLQHAIDRDREIAWKNMVYELEENQKEETCFANYKGFLEDEECKEDDECSPTRNRSGVYRFG